MYKKFRFFKIIALSVIICFLIAFKINVDSIPNQLSQKASENTDVNRPNILLLIADDLGYGDCSAYPNHEPDAKTPNIEKLAQRSVLFTQGYVTSPICSPSRLGILTGRYHQRWGTHTYTNANLPNDETTLAEYLKSKGYKTALFGKSHVGQAEGIMEREFPRRHGYENFVGRTGGMIDFLTHTFEDQAKYPKPLNVFWGFGPWYFNDSVKEVEGYTTDILTDQATQFIQGNKTSPFFLTMGYTEVHAWTHQIPDTALVRLEINKIENWDPKKEKALEWVVRDGLGQYMENGRTRLLWHLSQLDSSVGKIINTLEEEKLMDNTIIVFLSDNGATDRTAGKNTPLSGGKYLLEEGGLRVPFMISFPSKLQSGSVYNKAVSSMDIFPTIMGLCNDTTEITSSHFDGKNLVPFLNGEDTAVPHETLYWTGLSLSGSIPKFEDMESTEAKSYHSVGGDDSGWAIRDNDYKLRYFGRTKELKLFNLKNDIEESNDLSKSLPETVKRLKNKYYKWHNTDMHLPTLN